MKLTNKEIGSYLVWVAINLSILLISGEIEFNNGTFYPFSDGFEYINNYDISEFLTYTLIPFLVILAVKLLKGDKLKSE